MIRINSIGITLDTGVILPVNRIKSKIYSIGITKDYGVIPPKNYFKGKITSIGISEDKAKDSILTYQIL